MDGGSTARAERSADVQVALACFAIALGSLMLGVQLDARGHWVGTGYAALAIGLLIALATALLQASGGAKLPRDPLAVHATALGFLGLACASAGVLAPGGGWMFLEVALLIALLARKRPRALTGPELAPGAVVLLALLFLFRLWITYQGSVHRWDVITVEVPGIASIPARFLDPLKHVSLGSFTPAELGFPPSGIDFPVSATLWASGLALCVAGLYWRAAALREREDARIDALIHTLPPTASALVVRLIPEDEWAALGLHGLEERKLARRIEALVVERVQRQQELHRALAQTALSTHGGAQGFASGIEHALARYEPRASEGAR